MTNKRKPEVIIDLKNVFNFYNNNKNTSYYEYLENGKLRVVGGMEITSEKNINVLIINGTFTNIHGFTLKEKIRQIIKFIKFIFKK